MPKLPMMNISRRSNDSPHVVVLGAGASRAATPGGDRNGRRLPVMANLAEVVGLVNIFDKAGISWRGKDFEALYDELASSGRNAELVSKIETRVSDYFRSLVLPDGATLYDYLLLCLREKDVVATFNWDPFLAQAYRRNIAVRRLPRVLHLHGNVAIGVCLGCRAKGYAERPCEKCGKPFQPTPLLYPVRHKNYTFDPFIDAEWKELLHLLKYAYFLTIFGYSAPSTDTSAITLMRSVWDQNETRTLAEIEIIDTKPRDELHQTWKPFITREHYYTGDSFSQSYLCRYPRRSCEGLAWATLQNEPWRDNPIPHFESILELQEWISPLLAEEDTQEQQGTPFSGNPCTS